MPNDLSDTPPTSFDDPSLSWGDETSDAAPLPAPETDVDPSDAADPPEGAITPAATETPTQEDRPPQGPIPFDRHTAVLAAERTKREAVEAKLARVAWADTLQEAGKTGEQVQQALQMFDGITQDPVGFLDRFHAQLQQHPDLATPLRSWAGRVLASRTQGGTVPSGSDDQSEPQADFQNEQGIPFFSGPQLVKWQAWTARQQQAQFQAALAPLVADRTARQQHEANRILEQQQTQLVASELTELRKIPAFKENESKVKAYLEQHNYQVPLQTAWTHVLVHEILPTLSQTARTTQLTELQRKAGASTVTPRASSATTGARPTAFDDPSLEW